MNRIFFLANARNKTIRAVGCEQNALFGSCGILQTGSYCNVHRCPWRVQKFWSSEMKVKPPKRYKVPELDHIVETDKKIGPALKLKELLMKQDARIMCLSDLGKLRLKLKLNRKTRLSSYAKKYPAIFRVMFDQEKVPWIEFTEEAENLVDEEQAYLKNHHEAWLVDTMKKLLMLTVDRRIRLDHLIHARHDFGLPEDFRHQFFPKYPQFFRVVGNRSDEQYVELLEWEDSLAITRREQRILDESLELHELMGESYRHAFKMFPPKGLTLRGRGREFMSKFQSRPFLSPYESAKDLDPSSLEATKRNAALVHEFLSLTLEKRCLVDVLTHFRQEFRLPSRLTLFLQRFQGLFYTSYKADRYTVFLKESYKGPQLVERNPLLDCRDRLAEMVYRHTMYRKGRPPGVPFPEKSAKVTNDENSETEDEHHSMLEWDNSELDSVEDQDDETDDSDEDEEDIDDLWEDDESDIEIEKDLEFSIDPSYNKRGRMHKR